MNKYNFSKEDCKKIIEKYNSRTELFRENSIIYRYIYRKKWEIELFVSYKKKHKDNGYWTKTKCLEIAKIYSSKSELVNHELSLCAIARNKGWLDEVCNSITLNKWSKSECLEFAKKWKNKSEFRKNNREIYYFSKESGFLEEIFFHMKKKFVPLSGERLIYSYTFFNKYVYVGVTKNLKKRHSDHMRNGTVFNFVTKNKIDKKNIKPNIEISGIVNPELASQMEGIVLEEKEKLGLIKLNKAKTGGLGGSQKKWNESMVFEEAKKYKTRLSFARNSNAYSAAQRLGILDEVCSSMNTKKYKKKNYWTKSRCKLIASNFVNRKSFERYENSAYSKSVRLKWLDEFFPIINDEDNKENIKKIAIQYTDRGQLYKSNKKIYRICLKNKWLNEFLPLLVKDEEYCKKEINGIKNRYELSRKKHTIYRLCIKLNILDKFFPIKKFERLFPREYYLDKNNAKIECNKYENRTQLNDMNQILYRVCKKFNWLDEFYPPKFNIIYTYELCKEHASKFSCRKDYAINNRKSYDFASKNEWLQDFFGDKIRKNGFSK